MSYHLTQSLGDGLEIIYINRILFIDRLDLVYLNFLDTIQWIYHSLSFYGDFILANRCWDWTYIGNIWFSTKVFSRVRIDITWAIGKNIYYTWEAVYFIFYFQKKYNPFMLGLIWCALAAGEHSQNRLKWTLAYYYHYYIKSAKWVWWKVSPSRPRLGLHSRWFGVGLLIRRRITGNLLVPSRTLYRLYSHWVAITVDWVSISSRLSASLKGTDNGDSHSPTVSINTHTHTQQQSRLSFV